ncbi:hypothetical protein TKK_0003851 [Trichogramma kaykai]|uniref:OTU domain-containing protein n=1 Tax=Trichogramma kaykai TaxID=54128 RepID=A0ABD2XNA3_9HYME
MSNDNNAEEQLYAQHKKEKKDLQAKIQVLKKSICKGDKKKKKEVTEEIAKLELDLNRKHDEEVAQLKLSEVKIDNCDDQDTNGSDDKCDDNEKEIKPTVRVSKAQKRREKKETAEKERNQRILEQEALNVHGKRHIETQAIKNILLKRDLMIHEVPSDGHCLYNAVAHQLKAIDHSSLLGHVDLRQKTAVHLRENSDSFLPFIANPDSDDLLSDEQYEKYCDDVAKTSTWGGDIELQVLSNVLKCPIEVIQASGAPYLVGSEFESERKLTLTYHRHMYHLGAHYNSVTKYVKAAES